MCLKGKCGRAAVTQDWKASNVPLVWAITSPWRSWWARSGSFRSGTGRTHVWATEWRLSFSQSRTCTAWPVWPHSLQWLLCIPAADVLPAALWAPLMCGTESCAWHSYWKEDRTVCFIHIWIYFEVIWLHVQECQRFKEIHLKIIVKKMYWTCVCVCTLVYSSKRIHIGNEIIVFHQFSFIWPAYETTLLPTAVLQHIVGLKSTVTLRVVGAPCFYFPNSLWIEAAEVFPWYTISSSLAVWLHITLHLVILALLKTQTGTQNNACGRTHEIK